MATKARGKGGKDQKGGGGDKTRKEKPSTNNVDFQREEKLQAVVLADSFEVKLTPITAQQPKALLPVVNIPVIDYTLEFLVSGGVEEIFVFACAHADVISDYLNKSSWTKKKPQLTVEIIKLERCLSTGDALRHLDSLQLVHGDFVLVNGDIISNCKLDHILKTHKERVKEDKLNVMTIVVKKAPINHRSRALEDDLVVAVDRNSGRLLFYDDDPSNHDIQLPLELFDEHSEVQVRYDLMDTYIDIYTPEALMLWTDNFDYDTRQDFICGILGAEILGNKIHTCEVSNAYAARFKDFRTYDSISKDIIHRWTYPMVLENNLLGSCMQTSYKYLRRNIYKEDNVIMERSCVIGEDTVFGSGCRIGANTTIRQCVIGRNCIIGANCDLFGCYLWDGVVVEDNCQIDRSVLTDKVTLKKGAKILRGCVLSFDVVVGPGHVLPEYTKLTTLSEMLEDEEEDGQEDAQDDDDQDQDKEDDDQPMAAQAKLRVDNPDEVGKDGRGRVHHRSDDQTMTARGVLRRYTNSIAPDENAASTFAHPLEVDTDDEDEGESGGEEPMTKEDESIERFYREVRETLLRGQELKLPTDGITLEMSSLKFSHHAELPDYSAASYLAILGLVKAVPVPTVPYPTTQPRKPNAPNPPKLRLTKTMGNDIHLALKKWKMVLTKFGRETQDQLNLIIGLERACLLDYPVFVPLFPFLLEKSYAEDILSEEAILQWESNRTAESSPSSEQALVEAASHFLKWLRETGEDEGDEQEEEEEE